MGGSSRASLTIIFSWILRCIIASSILLPFVSPSSSASRSNYNVYNYDQTTPQFTPDGRLLQVEYASSAADQSAPLVVLEFTGGEQDQSLLAYPCTVMITIPKQPFSPQNRIVIIEKNSESKDASFLQKNTYCLAMSGILCDSLALLQAGKKSAAEHSLQYQEVLDMESFVQVLADECQSRVFAGGLRPYGSTLLLCGYDEDLSAAEEQNEAFRSLVYQTDPSGGILQHRGAEDDSHVSSKKKNSEQTKGAVRSEVRCIVGGSPGLQRQLYKQIQQGMARLEQKKRTRKGSPLSLADRIAGVAKILIKETTDAGSNRNAGNGRAKTRNSSDRSFQYPLEVVLLSPRLGCHRLEGKQLQAVQDLINTAK